jgi:choline dehydrogenase-like flavoprotein
MACSSSVIAGTAMMGGDAKSAVIDAELRSFDHPNLFVVGSAAFPTSGVLPPTLTIAALALRAAGAVTEQL